MTYLDKPRKMVMIENGKGTRYEFYTATIYTNQFRNKIAGYEPRIRCCTNLVLGSTWTEKRTSAEDGNRFYKEMIAKGFKRVTERTFA